MDTKIYQKNKNGKFTYSFSSYGVKISLEAFNREVIDKAKKESVGVLPLNPVEINFAESEHRFVIDYDNGNYLVKKNGELERENTDLGHILKFLEKEIKLTVAEFAVSKVFIHAGAVSYKNRGIIFPAKSFQGKTTLTAELVKAGATYYSDDCAVLDENAMLHPFPKTLSMRGIIDDFLQKEFPVEHFGGKAGVHPVEVKLIVLTEFEKGFRWSPELLSPGKAIMEIIQHTVPIRFNPKFSLDVLHKLVNRAIITKSKRGEAKLFTASLLKLIENID